MGSQLKKSAEKGNGLRLVKKILYVIFVAIITIVIAIPLIWVLLLSVKTNNEIFNSPLSWPKTMHFENYLVAFNKMRFFTLLKNTMYISIISIIGGYIINLLSSFAIARMKFGSGRIQNFFYLYFMTGIIMPVFVILFPIYMMNSKMGLINTYWSMILPYLGWSVPMDTLLLVGALRNFPSAVEEAAVIDGCNITRLIVQIVTPIIKPTLITVLIVSFLGMWNEFPLAVVMINKQEMYTIALAVSFFKGLYSINYDTLTAAIVIIMIPQIVFYSVFQRHIIEGVTAGAVKG